MSMSESQSDWPVWSLSGVCRLESSECVGVCVCVCVLDASVREYRPRSSKWEDDSVLSSKEPS